MNTTTEDSFISAWSKAKFPDENHTFVKSFCDDIGIAGFEFVPADYRYIVATRRDGTRGLRIHYGCTTGFAAEEAERLRPEADLVRVLKNGTWLVSHPTRGDVDVRGPRSGSAKPKADMCPKCGIYELSISGVCHSCDDD
jgi:hypothetical protein